MPSLAVIGLGYVGLPLAVQAAEKGYEVIGIDLNEDLVKKINNRETPYVNDERFAKAFVGVDKKRLIATTTYEQIKRVDNIVICVPTPTENNVPDTGFVRQAASQIAPHLKKGHFVSVESTVNPGVTRREVLPILEDSGLRVGEDFYLAHCPERIDPGNAKYFVGNLNRVVGGITQECTEYALRVYKSIIDAKVIPLGSTEEAEFVKSWENSQRNVMIAMANSSAIICDAMGMDIENIRKGLESKIEQFGLNLAQAGIGPGGHCIPEDIHFVIREARRNGIDTRFLDDAADLNDKMPRYAVHQLSQLVKSNGERLSSLNVALLGMAYKPNIADLRKSPSIEVGHILVREVNTLRIHDPFASLDKNTVIGARVASDFEDALKGSDAIFIGTAHDFYKKSLTPALLLRFGVKYILDGRNSLNKDDFEKAGIFYKGIGR